MTAQTKKLFSRQCRTVDDCKVRLQIWDTAGQGNHIMSSVVFWGGGGLDLELVIEKVRV